MKQVKINVAVFLVGLSAIVFAASYAHAAVDHDLDGHTDDTLSHVGFTWGCVTTRVNEDAFDCETEVKHYEVKYGRVGETLTLDIIPSNTRFADYDLAKGEYSFEVQVVDNWVLESGFTDKIYTQVNPLSPPSKLPDFVITVNGVVSVGVVQ